MLENILYHTIVIIFIGYLTISLFLLNKKYSRLKISIIPFMLKKEFILPKDRSFFIRGVRALEEMMSQKFGIQVCLKIDISREKFFFSEFECFFNIIFSNQNGGAQEFERLLKIINSSRENVEHKTIKNKTILFKQKANDGPLYNGSNSKDSFYKNVHSIWEISLV